MSEPSPNDQNTGCLYEVCLVLKGLRLPVLLREHLQREPFMEPALFRKDYDTMRKDLY